MRLGLLVACAALVAACSRSTTASAPAATTTGPAGSTAGSADAGIAAAVDAGRENSATRWTEIARFGPTTFPPLTAKGSADEVVGVFAFEGKPLLAGSHSLLVLDADAKPLGTIVQIAPWKQIKYPSPILIDGPRLLVAGTEGIMAVDPKTGGIVWQHPEATSLTYYPSNDGSGPVVVGDVLAYLAGSYQKNTLVALRAATGEPVWSRANVTVMVSDGTHLFIAEKTATRAADAAAATITLASLDAATGAVLWSTQVKAAPSWQQVGFSVDQEHLVFAQAQQLHAGWNGDYQSTTLLDTKTGAIRWTHDQSNFPHQWRNYVPHVAFGNLYNFVQPGLERADPEDGHVLWSDAAVLGSTTIDGDAILVEHRDSEGVVRALDATTGLEVWSYGVGLGPGSGADFTSRDLVDLDGDGASDLLDVHLTSSTDRTLAVFRRGPVAVAPHEKTVTLDVREAETFKHDSPSKPVATAVKVRIGGYEIATDAHGHGQGIVRGRGSLSIQIDDIWDQYLPLGTVLDMESGAATISLTLTLYPPEFEQACNPD